MCSTGIWPHLGHHCFVRMCLHFWQPAELKLQLSDPLIIFKKKHICQVVSVQFHENKVWGKFSVSSFSVWNRTCRKFCWELYLVAKHILSRILSWGLVFSLAASSYLMACTNEWWTPLNVNIFVWIHCTNNSHLISIFNSVVLMLRWLCNFNKYYEFPEYHILQQYVQMSLKRF